MDIPAIKHILPHALVIADSVLLIHLAFVVFVVLGFILIWAGFFLKWNFIRNRFFRFSHLFSIALVAGESVLGMTCPLTALENHFRSIASGMGGKRESLIKDIIHAILYYECEDWVFTTLYIFFLLIVITTFFFVPCTRKQ